MERLLLRPEEAAETLGIGRSKTYELLASGELPSIKVGRSMRVPTDALRAWIRDRTPNTQPLPPRVELATSVAAL